MFLFLSWNSINDVTGGHRGRRIPCAAALAVEQSKCTGRRQRGPGRWQWSPGRGASSSVHPGRWGSAEIPWTHLKKIWKNHVFCRSSLLFHFFCWFFPAAHCFFPHFSGCFRWGPTPRLKPLNDDWLVADRWRLTAAGAVARADAEADASEALKALRVSELFEVREKDQQEWLSGDGMAVGWNFLWWLIPIWPTWITPGLSPLLSDLFMRKPKSNCSMILPLNPPFVVDLYIYM